MSPSRRQRNRLSATVRRKPPIPTAPPSMRPRIWTPGKPTNLDTSLGTWAWTASAIAVWTRNTTPGSGTRWRWPKKRWRQDDSIPPPSTDCEPASTKSMHGRSHVSVRTSFSPPFGASIPRHILRRRLTRPPRAVPLVPHPSLRLHVPLDRLSSNTFTPRTGSGVSRRRSRNRQSTRSMPSGTRRFPSAGPRRGSIRTGDGSASPAAKISDSSVSSMPTNASAK